MLLQCKNCKRKFRDNYKLRRHYLSYLPYYFGSYICVICDISFETELKLHNHIIKQGHTSEAVDQFDVGKERRTYFDIEHNKYFGSQQTKFEETDIKYLIGHKGVTNLDVQGTIDGLTNSDTINSSSHSKPKDMDFNSRSLTSNLYETINSNPATTSFETNVFKSTIENANCFPEPPVSKSSIKRKVSNVPSTSTYQGNEQSAFENIERRLQSMETRLDNLERTMKFDIQAAKTELIEKIELNMQYQQQLFDIMVKQLKAGTKEALTSMLQGALSSQLPSNQQ